MYTNMDSKQSKIYIEEALHDKQDASIEAIEMDFDTCVLKQHQECVFVQDSNGEMDHRTQMGYFCGHDEVSFIQNLKLVLQEVLKNKML